MVLLANNRKQAYNTLYQQYSPMLYGYILQKVKERSVANDVLLDSMKEIWRKISQYNPAKGSLYLWMMKITRANLCQFLAERNIVDEDCSTFELVLHKAVNCKEAAELSSTSEKELIMDLRKALQTAKHSN